MWSVDFKGELSSEGSDNKHSLCYILDQKSTLSWLGCTAEKYINSEACEN